VLEEMKKAEPHHGDRWQRVSKDPANAHASLETILKKVIVDIDNQPAP
jgi:pre-mRNA-processing factor 6